MGQRNERFFQLFSKSFFMIFSCKARKENRKATKLVLFIWIYLLPLLIVLCEVQPTIAEALVGEKVKLGQGFETGWEVYIPYFPKRYYSACQDDERRSTSGDLSLTQVIIYPEFATVIIPFGYSNHTHFPFRLKLNCFASGRF